MLLQVLMVFGFYLVAAEGRVLFVTYGLLPLSTSEPIELNTVSDTTWDDLTFSRSAPSSNVTSPPVTPGDTGGGKSSAGMVNVGVAVAGWVLAAGLAVILVILIYRRGGCGNVATFFRRLGSAIGAFRVTRRNIRGTQQSADVTHGNQPPENVDRRASSRSGVYEIPDDIDRRASSTSAVYEVTEDTDRHSGPRRSTVYENVGSFRTSSSSSNVNAASDQPASSSENPARQSQLSYAPLSRSRDQEHDYTELDVA